MKTRILIYDIETSPIVGYTWGIWQQNVIEVIDDWQILSVAWHWLGDDDSKGRPKVTVKGQDDYLRYKPGVNDDTDIVSLLWELFDRADLVVAHNGDSFDQKKSQARMLIRGLKPPAPYKQTDTKKIAKRIGAFTSNSLKHLAKDMEVAQKGNAGGFETWKGCLAGDKKAWKKMKQYNKEDIPPLIDLYLKLRPWDNSAIPLNVTEGRPEACPKCGKEGTMNAGMKYKATNANLYQYFRCKDCGGMSKSRIPEEKFYKHNFVNR